MKSRVWTAAGHTLERRGGPCKKKLVEYKAAVRRGDTNNGIVVHAWDHQHRVDWENSSVMKQEPGYWKRSLRVATRGH